MAAMSLEIHLLGTPTVVRDGASVAPPRGAKPWALLAYVLLSATPVSRVRLASLLFSEAEDPLGTVRWNLNAVRRVLDDTDTFRGDPIHPSLAPDTTVDALRLRGPWSEAIHLDGLGRDLLEGMSFGGSPGFEAWLTAERRRIAADSAWVLREAALARLASGDATGAIEASSRLVAMDPLDEGGHELLVRALVADHQEKAARAHLERATQLIRAELGVEPGPELLAACETQAPRERPVDEVTVRAAMEAGIASIYAGQIVGVRTLQQAVADARTVGDQGLLLRSLLTYAAAQSFTDTIEGEEGPVGMHEAVALADRFASPRLAARVQTEVAFNEYWRAHYDRAEACLRAAADLAGEHERETSRLSYIHGCILTETARYDEAIHALDRAVGTVDHDRNPNDATFALAMLGRAHLLRGMFDEAETALDRALSMARSMWTAFVPWVESLRAGIAIERGEIADAETMLEHAYALACHHYRSNRCQSLSARGLGIVSAAKGDLDSAVRWLDVARTRGPRSDMNSWFRAYALDTLCRIAIAHHLPGARTWTAELEEAAGRHGMRDLLARALLHRGRLGDEAAFDAARTLAADIDSAALHGLIATP